MLQVVGRQSQQAVGGHRAAAAHVQQSQPGRVAQQPSQVGIIHPTAAVSFRMVTLSSSSVGNPGAGPENSRASLSGRRAARRQTAATIILTAENPGVITTLVTTTSSDWHCGLHCIICRQGEISS